MKRKGDPLYKTKIKIIDRLVEEGYNKGMELKMVNTLIHRYTLDFMKSVRLDFTVKSLIWFLGKGRPKIEEFYHNYLRRKYPEEKKEIELEQEKIGEDLIITKKQKLTEFLNEKKEIN